MSLKVMIKREDLSALLIGMMATLAGVGIARLAYTPLLPELIQQKWFNDSQAAYLGAANLLGYLIGALSAHRLSEKLPIRFLMGLSFFSISLSFALCFQPVSFEWFFACRMIAGVAGAILVVVGPSIALSVTPASRRATVGAFVFTGIGLGAVLSAALVPLLLHVSLSITWLALGGLSILVGIVCHRGLVNIPLPSPSPSPSPSAPSSPAVTRHGVEIMVCFVMASYALDAIGYIPHTMFWVDYLSREQALGTQAASVQWAIFGVGAVCGPLIAGFSANRLGCSTSLNLAFIAKALAIAIPLLSIEFISRTASSFIVGAMVPSIVALTSARIVELVGPAEHKRYWGLATAAFAIAQAFSGYAMSALYDVWGSYYLLFAIGSGMLAGSFILAVLSRVYLKHKLQTII